MCGIAALFQYGKAARPTDAEEWLRLANKVRRLRGPDGEGVWLDRSGHVGIAHRRLAIIDLSPSGAQPMTSADGLLHITFNGEIYNYKALRDKLTLSGCWFVSNSDTEVLLHLYREYGRDMVAHLPGMWLFPCGDTCRSLIPFTSESGPSRPGLPFGCNEAGIIQRGEG